MDKYYKLLDYYTSLEAFLEDLDIEDAQVIEALDAVGLIDVDSLVIQHSFGEYDEDQEDY